LSVASAARRLGVTRQSLNESVGGRARFLELVFADVSELWAWWNRSFPLGELARFPDAPDERHLSDVWHALIDFAAGEARRTGLGVLDEFVAAGLAAEEDEFRKRLQIAKLPTTDDTVTEGMALVRGLRSGVSARRLTSARGQTILAAWEHRLCLPDVSQAA
jgi:AcrR family transcriptional regulator